MGTWHRRSGTAQILPQKGHHLPMKLGAREEVSELRDTGEPFEGNPKEGK